MAEDGRAGGDAAGASVTVKLVFMGELKRWARRREMEVELPQGSTIQTLATKLSSLCGPEFAQRAMTKEGAIQPHVAVFINGVQMGELEGTQSVLTGGQVELMLLPMHEGGASSLQ
jgi:hypothetical protein